MKLLLTLFFLINSSFVYSSTCPDLNVTVTSCNSYIVETDGTEYRELSRLPSEIVMSTLKENVLRIENSIRNDFGESIKTRYSLFLDGQVEIEDLIALMIYRKSECRNDNGINKVFTQTLEYDPEVKYGEDQARIVAGFYRSYYRIGNEVFFDVYENLFDVYKKDLTLLDETKVQFRVKCLVK